MLQFWNVNSLWNIIKERIVNENGLLILIVLEWYYYCMVNLKRDINGNFGTDMYGSDYSFYAYSLCECMEYSLMNFFLIVILYVYVTMIFIMSATMV